MSSTPVSNVLRAALDKREQLNVLCFFLDGRFEQELIDTGHNIYGCEESFLGDGKRAEGLKYIPRSASKIDKDIVFDLIVYNHFETQAIKAQTIGNLYHVPVLGIQHFLPSAQIHPKQELVFMDEAIKEQFSVDGDVIHYGVKDSGESTVERETDVLIHGTFLQKDYGVLKHISEMQFTTEIYGNNPGFSKDIDYDTLTDRLKRTKIFINLSTHAGVPYSALLAMMNGCAIVSNRNEITPSLFSEEFTVFCKNLSGFAPNINEMLNGDWEGMGKKARNYALQKHNYDNSVALWKQKLETKAKEVFIL